MNTISNEPLTYYLERLEQAPFAFVRFGNGEWDCIFETRSVTGSGSQRLDIPKLRQGMIAAAWYNKQDYLRGVQSKGYLKQAGLWKKVEAFPAPGKWYAGDVFHRASSQGQLYPLIKYLRQVKVGVVGPRWLHKLEDVIGYEWFVEVEEQDCFQSYSKIRTRIALQSVVDVISFSAGPTTKVLIRQLHPTYSRSTSMLDLGSLWDVFCGVKSRGYHRKMSERTLACNLGQRS